jgi:nucleotide-binding universal stress UspA family protein
MSAKIIVAYDATPHADDALVLGRRLAERLQSTLVLAHVYRGGAHAPAGREDFLHRQSEALLVAAAQPGEQTRALGATTTATGLRRLATDEHALAIVLGSAHDGPEGHAHPGSAARRLLQGSPSALVFAPAELRTRGELALRAVAAAHDDVDGHAAASAAALSSDGVAGDPADADLLVLGSREGADPGRVMVSAGAEQAIQGATVPVLVLPAGSTLAPARVVAAAA